MSTVLRMLYVVVAYVFLVRVGQIRLHEKFVDYSTGFYEVLKRTPYNDCEARRFIKAGDEVVADESFNAFHEFANWNTDYLAKQPKCEVKR